MSYVFSYRKSYYLAFYLSMLPWRWKRKCSLQMEGYFILLISRNMTTSGKFTSVPFIITQLIRNPLFIGWSSCILHINIDYTEYTILGRSECHKTYTISRHKMSENKHFLTWCCTNMYLSFTCYENYFCAKSTCWYLVINLKGAVRASVWDRLGCTC